MKRITAAGLRKLAERKGLDVEEHDRGHGKQVEIWWSGHMTHFATIHDSLDLEVCRRAAYGILNGMPDKPKDKKRGEGK